MQDIVSALSKLPLFASLPAGALEQLASMMEPGRIEAGGILFHKGDPGGDMYLVSDGLMRVVLIDEQGQQKVLRDCGPGQAIGEMSLFDAPARTATVIAAEPASYLRLAHADFRRVVAALPEDLQGTLRDVAAGLRAGYTDLLKGLPLFQGLPDALLAKIASQLEGDSIDEGEVLFRKGDPGDALYVIDRGWFKIVTVGAAGEELILNQCGPTEAIGEMSLIDEQPRSASAIALTPGLVLKLSREDFLEVLAQYPQMAQHMLKKLTARMRFSTTYIEQAIEFARHIAEGDYDFVMNLIQSSRSAIIEEEVSDEVRATEMLTAWARMVESISRREEELKQQIRQLTIQIDQTKRREEVETVTGSHFFADLKAAAQKLRQERDAEEQQD